MGSVFRPMKGEQVDATEFGKLRFPLFASPKLDGYRCLARAGLPLTSALKTHGNLFVQSYFNQHAEALQGLDGELVVGEPNSPDVFDRTGGAIRRSTGEPDFRFWVFDVWDQPGVPFNVRRQHYLLRMNELPDRVCIVDNQLITSLEALIQYEEEMLELGYEGIMLRSIDGPYKYGRSSVREGYLLKVKRWIDAEARIIGFYEEMFNGNEAQKDAFGRTKRSSCQEKKTGKGTLGGFHVVGVNGKFKGVEFDVGGGYTAAQRAEFWHMRQDFVGTYLTYKFFDVGTKDKPRFPGFKGLRDKNDIEFAA